MSTATFTLRTHRNMFILLLLTVIQRMSSLNTLLFTVFRLIRGWSGDAMAQGKLPVPVRPTIWQGPIALAVGAGGGCLDILLSSILSLLFHPLWETVRYRLTVCCPGLCCSSGMS